MIEKEQVIQWLKDGDNDEAAAVLAKCTLGYEWVDVLFEMTSSRECELYDVRIQAPRGILDELETGLAGEKDEIEKAVKDCLSAKDCAIRSFEWVPRLPGTSARTEPTQEEEEVMEVAFASWLQDLDELLEDSAMTPQQKADAYMTWYYRVDQHLTQIGVLGDEPDSVRHSLWGNAESSGFPRDYEDEPSVNSLIRAGRTALQAIRENLRDTEPVVGELFPLEVVDRAKGFAEDVARQANGCYEKGWYDACAVMVRRLIEILIIDCFEVHGLLDAVKDEEGNIFGLGRLVEEFLEEPDDLWHVERSARPAIRKLKDVGDRAAHGRYQKTYRESLDRHGESLEIALQQLACVIESGLGR